MICRFWTAAEITLLRQEYPEHAAHEVAAMLGVNVKRVWAKAGEMKLRKSAAWWEREKVRLSALAKSNAGLIEHQMRPGQTPWNAGKSYMPGGNCKNGWFRKGQISKRWDQDDYAVGALRIDKDDFQIKVGDGQWESMGRYAWFLMTGEWPKVGYVVVRKNGDHFDVRDENLECIHRRELVRRNSVWSRFPPEYAHLVQLKGAITRQVKRIEREHQ